MGGPSKSIVFIGAEEVVADAEGADDDVDVDGPAAPEASVFSGLDFLTAFLYIPSQNNSYSSIKNEKKIKWLHQLNFYAPIKMTLLMPMPKFFALIFINF